MNVYVASSWRNTLQPRVVTKLREAGHEVYDFREPKPGQVGFSWSKIDPNLPVGPADIDISADHIRATLAHEEADRGFDSDMAALSWCDALVLVLPCGRSAHLEAGWAAGMGKDTIGLLSHGEPDLMWKMLDYLCVNINEVIGYLGDS